MGPSIEAIKAALQRVRAKFDADAAKQLNRVVQGLPNRIVCELERCYAG